MEDRRRARSVSAGKEAPSPWRSIVLHAFSDLSRTSPLFFVYILKQSYVLGNGKAVMKFQALRRQVMNTLPSAPPPGPATYVVRCLNVLLLVDPPYSEGLSHLLTSALSCLNKVDRPFIDDVEARKLAAQLFYSVVTGSIILEQRILVKLATVFDLGLKDLEKVIDTSALGAEKAKLSLETFILKLIRSRLYSSAVSLLKQFALHHSTPQEFLVVMVRDNQIEAAEQWAAYMGKHMICSLIQHCTEMNMFKKAYQIVKKHNLKPEFPDAYYRYRKSSLRKLVIKGCWDIAEIMTNGDRQLVEYLVVLAQEIGDATMATDICHRYCLQDFPLCPVEEDGVIKTKYLQLQDLIPEEHVIWVDTIDGLIDATKNFAKVKVVGIDCEWRPNYVKGKKPSKVSILQIATGKKVFIFDLIKLFQSERDALDICLQFVFHSANILKLGYALHNDLEQLLHSYGDLQCFHYCESTLDLQTLFGFSKGGLSGLAKIVLGGHLNKMRRASDWEERPLSHSQLHYAALDAAVLISIFNNVCREPLALGSVRGQDTLDWKSHVTCFRTNLKLKKPPAALNRKAESVDALVGKESSDDLIPMKTLNEYDGHPCLDWKAEALVTSGLNVHTPINLDTTCALEEELVYASCALWGLPMPGLLKSELQHYAQVAKLSLPIYDVSHRAGPGNIVLFDCSVTIGSMKFYGRPASSKKAAEIWAALHALSYLADECMDQVISSRKPLAVTVPLPKLSLQRSTRMQMTNVQYRLPWL